MVSNKPWMIATHKGAKALPIKISKEVAGVIKSISKVPSSRSRDTVMAESIKTWIIDKAKIMPLKMP